MGQASAPQTNLLFPSIPPTQAENSVKNALWHQHTYGAGTPPQNATAIALRGISQSTYKNKKVYLGSEFHVFQLMISWSISFRTMIRQHSITEAWCRTKAVTLCQHMRERVKRWALKKGCFERIPPTTTFFLLLL